jgi:hypothetical protein
MVEITRNSPVSFQADPVKTEVRNGWTVALEYSDEEFGPYLIDISHKTRWDLQAANLNGVTPFGVAVPDNPGTCTFKDSVMINRMNRTQAAVWYLGKEMPELPAESAYTDVTESTVFLALFGPHTFLIAEKLSALDFLNPQLKPPFLLQGPFSHVPCQMVTLNNTDRLGAILLTCSRGYGQDMVSTILKAGMAFGLQFAGEKRFDAMITST